MNRMTFIAVLVAAGLMAGCGNEGANAGNTPGASQAETPVSETQQREVTFSVPDMTCPMCPITVRKALARVDDVNQAEASLVDRQARVVFDPAKTSIDALIAAVAGAGFTATPDGEAHE